MLEFFLEPIGQTSLVFQIENQSDVVTNYVKSRGIFYASNGWSVTIDNEPEIDLDHKTIYLRGHDKELDTKLDRHWNMKPKEQKEAIKSINQALREVVEAAKKGKGRPELHIYDRVVIRQELLDPLIVLQHMIPNVIIVR